MNKESKSTLTAKNNIPGNSENNPFGGNYSGMILNNKYKLTKKIGGGGMGMVYLGIHVVLEKNFAVKILKPQLSSKKGVSERFLREAKAASSIQHSTIINVSDYGRSEHGLVYIVMEYVDGVELSNLIEKEGKLPWERVKNIALQITRALEIAHDKGVIHRDIKPANIFILNDEEHKDAVKIIDFGIAKVRDLSTCDQMTKTGTIMGTPEYMSPEQANGEKITFSTDIYSTGIIIYEMLTGQVPFKADSIMKVMTKHIMEKPKQPSTINKDNSITQAMDHLILKALSKKAENRYASMKEFREQIETINEQGHGPKAVLPEYKKNKEKKILLSIAVAVVIGLAFLLLYSFFKDNSKQELKENNKTFSAKKSIKNIPEQKKEVPEQKTKKIKISIKTNAPKGIVKVFRGQISIVRDNKIITLEKDDPAGNLPLQEQEFIASDSPVIFRLSAPGYKPTLYSFVPKNNLSVEKLLVKIPSTDQNKKSKKKNLNKKKKKI
ncbi:MAG: serine/threonine-protein kinase [Deltaproteobacteria bacterium]|jgi:serine/threonine protein kinase|nr:serine/threonine-protein kinase [Deltaproteobacteria bacterium]